MEWVNSSFTLIVCLMAVFLNHSGIIFDINASLSDIFCLLASAFLFYRKKLKLPYIPIIFFIVLSIYTLFTSFFYVPSRFFYFPDMSNVIINYSKLLVVFLYFILGYNLKHLNLHGKIIKWYSISALFIGFIGVLFMLLHIELFSSLFFYGGLRFRGFMNDPNYFSILQITALEYFSRNKVIKKTHKIGILIVIFLSILASGSKTGFIALLCYALLRILESGFMNAIKPNVLVMNIIILITSILIGANFSKIQSLFENIASIIPAFSRVKDIFTDFNYSITGMGSGRTTAWNTAVNLIRLSPIMGIGIGTYSGMAEQFFNTTVIAHNTYLQLFCEWGVILSTVLFIYIFYIISKAMLQRETNSENSTILRNVLIIFLVGSFSISLNNARMFWLFLGMMSCVLHTRHTCNT